MKAVQHLAHGCPGTFELREVPDPKPGPGKVIVEVQACGLNHLDLWLEQGELPIPLELPRTPGGEIAGRVREVAEDVRSWREGDAVAVQSNLFCGRCLYCQRGDESMCRQPVTLGVQRDGGFAERVCVPERALVRLPAGVDFQTSAALTLAGSTAMHMLTNRVQVRSHDWVLVIGPASGVGSAAIQIARQLGAHVIATASSEPKSALARRLGAEFVVDSTETNWPAAVRQITSKQGVDVVVEHVGGEVLVRALHG